MLVESVASETRYPCPFARFLPLDERRGRAGAETGREGRRWANSRLEIATSAGPAVVEHRPRNPLDEPNGGKEPIVAAKRSIVPVRVTPTSNPRPMRGRFPRLITSKMDRFVIGGPTLSHGAPYFFSWRRSASSARRRRPHCARRVRRVVERRTFAYLSLTYARLEVADDLAVIGIGGHTVPGPRREVRRASDIAWSRSAIVRSASASAIFARTCSPLRLATRWPARFASAPWRDPSSRLGLAVNPGFSPPMHLRAWNEPALETGAMVAAEPNSAKRRAPADDNSETISSTASSNRAPARVRGIARWGRRGMYRRRRLVLARGRARAAPAAVPSGLIPVGPHLGPRPAGEAPAPGRLRGVLASICCVSERRIDLPGRAQPARGSAGPAHRSSRERDGRSGARARRVDRSLGKCRTRWPLHPDPAIPLTVVFAARSSRGAARPPR